MIRSLEDAIELARGVDGEVVAMLVVDWSAVKALFDREGLWEERRLEEWLSAGESPLASITRLLEIRYATSAAHALFGANDLVSLKSAIGLSELSVRDLGLPAIRGFRTGGGPVDVEPTRPIEGMFLMASRLHRPTRDEPYAVTFVRAEEARAARRELRQTEARYRGIVEDQTDFIVRYREDGVRTFVNEPYAAFFGGAVEDFIGSSFLPLVVRDHRPAVEEKIRRLVTREADVLVDEHLSLRHDGVACWTHWVDRAIFDEDGRLVELQAVGRDITAHLEDERQRLVLEQRLAQAQKMEALGTLAGGLAHDFNNSLTSILAYSGLIRGSTADREILEFADSIRHAAERASELTRSLLQLSHRSPGRLARCHLQEIVESAGRLLRASIPQRIALRISAAECDPVLADAGQLTQALINLGLNARDAIPERGTIEITALSETEDDRDLFVLRVSDDGVGIPEPVRARLFEPFFTTKSEGRGTGLGLPMVYACASAHGGRVEVKTEVGQGTTIELWLPLAPFPLDQPEIAIADVPGGETVLVVDDEPMVLLHCRQTLEASGYDVLTAGSGNEALTRHADRIDQLGAVLTDLVMTDGDGIELEHALHARRPSLPVLLMTGGLVDRSSGDFAAVLEKPFSADELRRLVRRILDLHGAAGNG